SELNKNNPRKYRITSSGIIGNKKRIIEQEFEIGWVPNILKTVKPGALFVQQNINISNGTVDGDIGTYNKKVNSINLTGGTLKGKIYVPIGHENPAIKKLDWINVAQPTPIEMGEF